jgi:hypothetical protein
VQAHFIDPRTRDLSADVIGPDGCLRILPASFWAQTTKQERGLLCVRNGVYCLPTLELVERLREMIAGRIAIEIGAGNGVLAQALGIPATDNRMQEDPTIRAAYRAQGQAPVRYGAHVERLDAHEAVEKYRPEVVIGAWITHRYDPSNHAAGGNMFGPDEFAIVLAVQEYILIGHEGVHAPKPLWRRPHTVWHPQFLYSRAMSPGRDFIASFGSRLAFTDPLAVV